MDAAVVTIGIPTYNRAALLRRAIDSARAQTWPNLEILVCDNASTDDTEAVCRGLAAADARIRYVRHARNGGGTFNFQYALEHGRSEFFMWLADDDWIEPDYVAACLQALADPRVVIAAAPARLYRDGGRFERADVAIQARQADPARRVLAYYAQVSANSIVFGVMRRAAGVRAGLPHALAGDWLCVAGLALQGEVVTVTGSGMHRLLGGMGDQHAGLVRSLGLPSYQARLPHLVIAWNAARHLLGCADRYGVSGFARLRLAWTAALILVLRNSWWRRLMPRRWRLPYLARFSAGA